MVLATGQHRQLIGSYFFPILVVVVLVGLLGGFVTYQIHVSPGEETETVEESSWATTTEFEHEATITQETDVFAEGETLVNQPVYFTQLSPVLDGAFLFSYTATESGELAVETSLTLELQAADDDVEYWTDEETLETETTETLEPGDSVSVPFSLNIPELEERIEEIEEQLGATPGEVEKVVRAELEYSGEKNGIAYENQVLTHEMTVSSDGNTYSVEGAEADENSEPQFTEQTVTTTHNPLLAFSGPVMMLFAGGVLIVLVAGRENDWFTLTPDEQAWYEYQAAREEYDDWITPGRLPEEVDSSNAITIDSLEGIVDVAIDSSRRVIDVVDQQKYVVRVDETTYLFTAPSPPAQVDENREETVEDERTGLLGNVGGDPLFGTTDGPDETNDTGEKSNGTQQISGIEGIGTIYAERLADSDIKTLQQLADTESETVASIADVSEKRATDWIQRAREEVDGVTTPEAEDD